MEGFDLSRSLHNAFAPIDNDAYKWQRIYDTRLQWQMQNEKAKNDLRLLRVSDASNRMKALSDLQYNIMPGPDQEYVNSVLAPLKDSVNEIYGGLMSGQDTEYYLEEAGKIFTVANNLLNNDPRLKQSIAISNLLQSETAKKQKELEDKDKFDIDASREFQTRINELNNKYSKGEISLDQYYNEVRNFDTRHLYSIKDLVEEGKNIKTDSITRQIKPKVGYGFQIINEKVNDDKVFSLLKRGIERIGGNLSDIFRYVDSKGKPITMQEYNAIKDENEKQKYKLTYITNSIHCGNNKKCSKVVGSIIPVLPGNKDEQTYSDLGKSQIQVDAEKEKETYKNKLTLDKAEYDKLVEMALKNIEGINDRLKAGLRPEETALLEAEKKYWNNYIENLRKPTTEEITPNQGVKQLESPKEGSYDGTYNIEQKDAPSAIIAGTFKKRMNQPIGKDANKETIKAGIASLFKAFGKSNNEIITIKDGNITLNKDYEDRINNLIDTFATPDKIKLYKEKGYTYKQIFDDLIPNVEQGWFGRTIRDLAGAFLEDNKTQFYENELSKIGKGYVEEVEKTFKDEDIKLVQLSHFNKANPKAQRELTDYIKSLLDNTIISEKGGDRIDVSKIQNVEGIDYIGDKLYIRADILDKDNKLKQVKLSIDSTSEETIFDEVRRKMIGADANNAVLNIRDPNYDRTKALINTNYKTFKQMSFINDVSNYLQGINKISDNKRKRLNLTSSDSDNNVTIEYTDGSMPVEITYSVDEKNNTINDIVQLRYYRYTKDGTKQYLQDRPYYIHILGNKDNFDEILSYTHSSIKDMEKLQRKEYEEYLKKEQENKNGNKSNS